MSISAIVLAGGMGTRLKSVVNNVPKPMALVAGKPFITYVLNQLYDFGIQHVVLSVGYKYEVIQAYFGKQFKGMKIDYSVEETPLGTGGGIREAMKFVDGKTALVLNGDTYFDVDLIHFIHFHQKGNYALSMALRFVESTDRYGAVMVDDQKIIGFVEKNKSAQGGFINAGIYLVDKEVFIKNSPKGVSSFETEYLQPKYEKFAFGGFRNEGYFIDIGIPEDYQKANDFFAKF